MTAAVRPPRPADVDAIVEALNEHSRAVHGQPEVTRAEIEAWFSAPGLDLERDVRIAVDAGGAVLGYADVGDAQHDGTRWWIDLRARPGYDAAPLLRAMEARVREGAVPGGLVRAFASGTDAESLRLFEAAGYRLVRHSLRMRIDLDAGLPEPEWPAGIGVRAAEASEERAVYEAHMEAFADHWEFHRDPFDEWRHWMLRPPHDPSLWYLAVDGEEIAGVCLCRPEESGEPALGWVAVLGVRPPWRRRGLALALLRHAFGDFRARGKQAVGLGVDAENTTGAVRLYERAGMRVVRRYDILEKPAEAALPSGTGLPL